MIFDRIDILFEIISSFQRNRRIILKAKTCRKQTLPLVDLQTSPNTSLYTVLQMIALVLLDKCLSVSDILSDHTR